MGIEDNKKVENLIIDTTAFIQNAPLHEIASNIITCPEVVDEIKNKRQLRRLVVLPYDLVIKEVFPENVKIMTDFAKKTGDYPSLSATDIKVMALTYQLEKEKNGVQHLRSEPILRKPEITTENKIQMDPDVSGFFLPGQTRNIEDSNKTDDEKLREAQTHEEGASNIIEEDIVHTLENDLHETDKELSAKFATLDFEEEQESETSEILVSVDESDDEGSSENDSEENDSDDDDSGWITPSNVNVAKKQVNSQLLEDKHVSVACLTTDFAMQNVLRQMNLNVSALDGRIIKQLRTYILRCYACFKTTSDMNRKFCPKCGNDTLKKVSYSLDEDGKMQIHINPRKPLTGRGKKFSLPRIRGGKHPNNPILVADQPMAQNRPSRLARMKNNPLDDDYIAGFSPFVTRDVNSKSAQLCIRPGSEFKHWMRKNPNEARRKRK